MIITKHCTPFLLGGCLAFASLLHAQGTKPVLSNEGRTAPAPERLGMRMGVKPAVPVAENPFALPRATYKPLPALRPATATGDHVKVTYDAAGQAIFWQGKTSASGLLQQQYSPEQAAVEYAASLQLEGIRTPLEAFSARLVQTDEQGNLHVRLQQQHKGVPVYGAELVAHSKGGQFQSLNGRYYPDPAIEQLVPNLSAAQAIEVAKRSLGSVKEVWSDMDLMIVGGTPFQANLVIYHVGQQHTQEYLVWYIEAHPNLMERVVLFLDAHTGSILNRYNHTCDLGAGRIAHNHSHSDSRTHAVERGSTELTPTPPVTGNGTDLLGVNRTFGAWQSGGTYYLEDASQTMFNSAASQMPNEPVGAILTLDALNTTPANESSFDYVLATSNSTNFSNTTAVSTHYNSIQSYTYFKQKFNRNSIDGVGGNIIAFYNVSDDDGSSMENAFWNGAAMWYGNGGSTFRRLARGLDVGGHEMTHGVIEKTANLEYQNESGALNESFADVFAACIDADDWRIGEDVMQPNTHTCLRDLSNPNNGVSSNSPWWQPANYSERYTGNQDNGGVHINSGITNRAFYLFATSNGVGRDKAEQVYYKALRDFLTKSSRFIDCRIAVLQAANDLYGSSVANAAANAFDQVGILGSAPPSNPFGQLSTNPGTDYVLCVSDDFGSLDLADGNGNVLGTIYDDLDIKSRPSITDNGREIVFVNEEKHIILVTLTYGANIDIQINQLSTNPEWRNTAVSKDGRFLAATTDFLDNRIYVYDFGTNPTTIETFELYNPTYTEGQATGEVSYADVMEFDYEGEAIVYDAYNEVNNSQGQDLSYWDIGIVQYWENGQFTDGTDAPVSKLFSGLPENSSVGNPALASNSPFILAFDFYDGINDRNDIYGVNLETGDAEVIVSDNNGYGWPNYNRLDNSIIFHEEGIFGTDILRRGVTNSKITPQGNISNFISDHIYGVWFGNGSRSLEVSADEQQLGQLKMAVSPNPTEDRLEIRCELLEAGTARLSLSDLNGRVLLVQQQTSVAGNNTWSLDLSGLSQGHYLLQCTSDEGHAIVKVIKNR